MGTARFWMSLSVSANSEESISVLHRRLLRRAVQVPAASVQRPDPCTPGRLLAIPQEGYGDGLQARLLEKRVEGDLGSEENGLRKAIEEFTGELPLGGIVR